MKGVPLLQKKTVKPIEILLGGGSFQPAEFFQSHSLFNVRQGGSQLAGKSFQTLHRNPLGMIPGSPFQHPAGIVHLTQQKALGMAAAGKGVVRGAVLLLPQQHISTAFSRHPGQKFAPGRKEGKTDSPFGAGSHQSGRGAGIGEAENGFQGVQRKPGGLPLVLADHHIFAFQRQITVLGEHKQSVEHFSHGAPPPSTSSSRCSRT